MSKLGYASLAFLLLAGCETPKVVNSWPAVEVTAKGETDPVGTANQDAADDPAIWRNAANPAASLIVGTDKKAGLYVYGLDGKSRFFSPDGDLNNVDVVELGDGRVFVAASDRNDPVNAQLRTYLLDPASATLKPMGLVPAGSGEAYGFCMNVQGDAIHAFSVLKSGRIEEYRLTVLNDRVQSEHLRTRTLSSQAEGCVVDPRDGAFYVGEEDVGIWRFGATDTTGELVAKTDGLQLVDDVEGITIMPEGENGGWLLASSQGDDAYAVYALPDMQVVGRFRIADGALGSTQETDGIDLELGDFGPDYPMGLFVAQDGQNEPEAQNFKLVSVEDIVKALTAR